MSRYDPAAERAAMDAQLDRLMSDYADGLVYGDVCDVIRDTVTALKKQAAALAVAEYDPTDAHAVAKAQAHSAKVLDGVFRLVQFAKGAPDSRPDVGAAWLQMLTAEQLATVQGWIAAAEAKR